MEGLDTYTVYVWPVDEDESAPKVRAMATHSPFVHCTSLPCEWCPYATSRTLPVQCTSL
jgi:hypothetical protein